VHFRGSRGSPRAGVTLPRKWLFLAATAFFAAPALALDHTQLAVIVNTWDPLSVEIGNYYAAQRGISFQNFIKVGFRPGRSALPAKEFAALKAWADGQALPHIQAYALTWAAPYRVECMSITSAFAFGFDPAFCAEDCSATRTSPYFNSRSGLPFTQLHVRLSMAIAAASFEQAKALIDRGVRSDGTRPKGTAYLLSTSDAARNVRSVTFPMVEDLLRHQNRVRAKVLTADSLRGAEDILFYFTGMARVEGLETLGFLPGAVADHVTSAGGQLTDGGQMSALAWLDAGATGSYGAVVEPCNLPQKFPQPAVLIGNYLRGDTLIEAYWKSVAMPGQGIFVGEPLAAPFRPANR
jgi:uncharacterized protein (TIGR03790 family)